jgi:hypothetical protein
MENNTQKISKISVSSSDNESEYGSSQTNTVEHEKTPKTSTVSPYEDLISALSLTLAQRNIPHNSKVKTFTNLKSLITTLCYEFSKKVSLSKTEIVSEVSVVNKLFISEQETVCLGFDDRKMLLGLLIELLRGSNRSKIMEKVENLNMSLKKSAETIEKLQSEIFLKDKEISELKTLPQKSLRGKKNRYLESESTLNESQDIFL